MNRRKKGGGAVRKIGLLLFLVLIFSVFSFTPSLSKYVFNSIFYTVSINASATFDLTAIGATSGTPQVGSTLTAGQLTPSGATANYQWMSGSSPGGPYSNITGATSSSYTLNTNDYGKFIRVVATGYGYYSGSVTSEYSGPVLACPLTGVTVSGIASVGNTLSVASVLPSGATASYNWMRSLDNSTWTSTGVTASSYTLQAGDYGYYIKVVATGTGGYTGSVSSSPLQVSATSITGTVTITGAPAAGNTLSSVANLTPSGATVTYQWMRSTSPSGAYTDISGATSSTYIVQAADEGYYIKLRVTGYNGYTGTITSDYVGPVATSLISIGPISGSPQYGSTLTAGAVTPSGATVTYQWQRALDPAGPYSDIASATSNTYTLTNADVGYYIVVRATGSGNYGGTVTSAYIGPVTYPITSIAAPTGTPQYTNTLTAGAVAPYSATVTYQWQSGASSSGPFTDISGATSSTYTLTANDIGKYIVVKATGTGNYSGTVTSPSVGPVAKRSLDSLGAISGNAAWASGSTNTLTAGSVAPSGATVTYQWYNSTNGSTWSAISGATLATYTTQSSDVGKYIRVTATGTGNYEGSVSSPSAGPVTTPVTGVSISGTAKCGNTLTASSILPSGATVTYQWMSSSTAGGIYTDIAGATSSTYVLQSSDYQKYIKVKVTGTGIYTDFAVSSYVGPVASTALTSVSITGTAKVGQTLTANPVPAGATVTYQWKSSLTSGGIYTNISGATGPTYTIQPSQVNRYIKVTVTGTGGYTGSVTSAATAKVTAATVNISQVNLSGQVGLGRTCPTSVTATDQFTSSSITWKRGSKTVTSFSVAGTYTATISLSAKTGYTFSGVPANFFTVFDSVGLQANTTSNSASSGTITATFVIS